MSFGAEKVHLLPGLYSNINTVRNTQWSLNTWNEWRLSTNSKITDGDKEIPSLDELPYLPLNEIDALLKKFIEDIQTPDGNDYPPDSIRNIVYGIQRHIRLTIPDINLFDKHCEAFKTFQAAYSKKIKAITVKGEFNRKKQAQPVSEITERKLWERGAFCFHQAVGLSNAVFFYTIKVFGLIAGESLRKLDTKHFRFGEDVNGKYIELDGEFAPSVNCRHYKYGMDPTDGSIRQYQDLDNQRCYYNLMVHYLKQISRAQLNGPLFLKPMQDKCFSNQALGENNLASKLSQIMRTHDIDGYYTNHSIVQAVSMILSSKGLSLRKLHGNAWSCLDISKLLDPPPGTVMETDAVMMPCLTQVQGNSTRTGSFFVQQQGSQLFLQQKRTPFPQTFLSPVSLSVTTMPKTVQNVLSNKSKAADGNECKLSEPKTKSDNNEVHMQEESNCQQKEQTRSMFPLYLSPADSTSVSNVGQDENHTSTDAENDLCPEELHQTMHIIKEEPADDYDYYGGNIPLTPSYEHEDYEKESSNDTFNSEMSTTISSTEQSNRDEREVKSPSLKKRKLEHTINERCNDSKQEEHGTLSEEPRCSNQAEVTLSFSKNLENGILKQAVQVKDNDLETFTCSSAYKTGRPIPNFELNLGDYLPGQSIIRPNDIQIKRVVTPGGGKIVLHVKYCNTD